MQNVPMAHLQAQGISFAVFDADAADHSSLGRQRLLAQLTTRARAAGLLVQKSALAFVKHGRLQFYGTPDLVDFLAKNWVPQWTHNLSVD